MEIDWNSMEQLRARFLSGEGPSPSEDYWASEKVLHSYDKTFGQRIAWKWRPVLKELWRKAPPTPAPVPLVDWGCGTGVASREYLSHFEGSVSSLLLYDRSKLAVNFAADRLRSQIQVPLRLEYKSAPLPIPGAVLLLSHVANELTTSMRQQLDAWISVASTVVWVEPGTPDCSRWLIETRERFRDQFEIVGPCPHQSRCGLTVGNSPDWCHFFASSPAEAFQTAFWKEFSTRLKIDLRSLPVSYLILSQKRMPVARDPRVLGRVRASKGMVKALICKKEGVKEDRILTRKDPTLVKRLKKGDFELSVPENYLE